MQNKLGVGLAVCALMMTTGLNGCGYDERLYRTHYT